MSTATLLNLPSVNNFSGSLHAATNLLSFTELSFPPLSLGGECARLALNGVNVQAHESRWYPYQVVRRTTVGTIELRATVRMGFEQQLVLLELELTNAGAGPADARVDLDLGGYLRSYPGTWEWTIPRQYGNFSAWSGQLADGGRVLTVTDSKSAAATAFAFPDQPDELAPAGSSGSAGWALSLDGGERRTIRIVVAAAGDADGATAAAIAARTRYPALFTQAKVRWEQRFADAFKPDNDHFSGSLPVLDTADPALHDLYYRGVVSVLALERTNYPQHSPRTYVTAGPQWGVATVYFWDTALFAPLLVLLDPAVARAEVTRWLELGIEDGYAVDAVSGELVGPWYSANDLSVFTMLLTYVTFTGDLAFLDEPVAGLAVLDHLQAIALSWQKRVVAATGLADYGARGNLLEQVSNYVNQVPSLNAANVWMMRQVAQLRERRGETGVAGQLRAQADDLAARVLDLYVPGEGVWQSVHNDGTRVAVRHIYDCDTIGRLLADDLTPTMRAEMTAFLTGELLAGGWLRALSPSDPNAPDSLRPDHGSNGAYDAWPALAAGVAGRFGNYELMRRLLTEFDCVGAEGPFSQSHQLVSEPSRVVVWDRADLNPVGGVTVVAWIKAEVWPAQTSAGSIVAKVGFAGAWFPKTAPSLGYALRGGGAGVISFAVAVGTTFRQAVSTATVPVGEWHQVVGTFDGQRVAVYVDGVLSGTTAARGSLGPAPGTNLIVGADPVDPESRFTGAVDEVRLYNRSLSAAEIADLYAADAAHGADDPALVLRLPMDEGSGDDTIDVVTGTVQSVVGGRWAAGRNGGALAFGRSGRVIPRISRQQYNENNGGAFTSVILQDFFGYSPDGEGVTLRDPATPRGVDARLRGVTLNGQSYTIVSDGSGVRLTDE
ncbi:LamG domain-containing protein [Micromonospora yasonensis]|uniref:LamG domain-containing protein n=1 Tax=Micromonospora yasonensis TaxID=1128667 RepID=UPI00223149D3|nr:LamG domain-containing protein [Micromonospora yasonensis]MCW3840688.1 LamG domain-containing protein [Micromonospora yasonensis]